MDEHLNHRPIKVIIPHSDDLHPPKGGGGKGKDFTEGFESSRGVMLSGISDIFQYYDNTFSTSNLPVVAKVTLRDDAIAKSHRPDSLFSPKTCPIIGNLDFGELLISVLPNALKNLKGVIEHANKDNDKVGNDISKILRIEPYKENDALGDWSFEDIQKYVDKNGVEKVKLRLFDHHNPAMLQDLVRHLSLLADEAGLPVPIKANYGSRLNIYKIHVPSDIQLLHHFSSFVGTQSLEPFEQFMVEVQSSPIGKVDENILPRPEPGTEYPVVGIIDTGTDPNNPHLQAWVDVRDESMVPMVDQNNNHGSMVAGVAINSKQLNNDHPGFPSGNVKVVDVVAIPSSGRIEEDDLIDAVRYATSTYQYVKVWNLSVNTVGNVCKDSQFSSFAMAIDEIMDEYGGLLVNSAGNFRLNPMPKWRREELGNIDRITSPADALRSITVGSIAHLSHANACAQPGEPSPFSRKGPGAAYVPKPELTHFGGNTDANGLYRQIGILSVDGSGNLAEIVGTSFAAPLVAATAAQLWKKLAGTPSRHLIKALMVHNAVLTSNVISILDLPYTGFGKPPSVEEMLSCKESEATLIFELDLPYSHRNFHKADFPVPPCLHRNGKVFGEIIMTLAYDPPVDPNDGAAYSQVNINPSVGVCWVNGDKEDYSGELIPYPKDYKDLYEKNQIQHGFKWSPVKVYRRSFSRITPCDMWRISLITSTRKPTFDPANQRASLIVTIRDPEGRLPVYDEVIQMMNRSGWITQDLSVRSQSRVRATN